MPLVAGTRLGHYEIVSSIGAGGMGEVYKAHDLRLKRDVALKVLAGSFSRDPERLARFHREAQVLASLNHAHIAHIHGLEEAGPALVMEFVEGEDLAEKVARGPIPLDETLAIARQITDALEAAHDRGIIHRDLKPANIKITPAGDVKVLDFGLAKAIDAGGESGHDLANSPTITSASTRLGTILGTAAYMSPEQAKGKAVDKRADIWAFGCVLFEMLSGARAFGGETVTETLAAILERQPDWRALPAHTPVHIVRLLRRCLEKDPKRRLRDIGDAQPELSVLVEDAVGGTHTAVAERQAWLPWVIAAVAVIVATTSWLGTSARRRDSADADALGPRLTRVTWGAGLAAEPALSPDGALVAYAGDSGSIGGGFDLWLQRVAGGVPIRLTDDPADDREPDFSPDGTTIVFRSDRAGGGVFVMPALGGNARLVAPEGRAPRFSPDRTHIAYWVGRTLGGTRMPGSRIFVVPANGGDARELAAGFAAARTPVWAPDGGSVLFFGAKTEATNDANWDWWWVPVSGGKPIATGVLPALGARGFTASGVSGIPGQDALPGVWTIQGVIFSAPLEQTANLWRVDMSATTGRSDHEFVRLTTGVGSDAQPAVDKSGTIAFQSATTTQGVFALALDSVAGRSLNTIERLFSEPSLFPHRGSVSDDGRLLAFPKHRVSESELWIQDLQTKLERHLATAPRTMLNPVISPDGSRVAYAVNANGRVSAHVVPAAGGTVRKLCDDCAPHAWLGDRRRILLAARLPNGGSQVRAVDVESGTAEEVFEADWMASRPTATRDGRWLAVNRSPLLGRVSVVQVRSGIVATPDTALTIELGGGAIVDGRHTGWSPDGRLLYLLLGLDGFRCLYAQRFDPARGAVLGDPFAVHHFHEAKGGVASTPEGTAIIDRAFIYDAFETTGSIWLLDETPRS